jgi:hypothetical protein
MVIAVTGQSSAACLQLASRSLGTMLVDAKALSASILKTAGQVSTHKPQPVQISASTFAFIAASCIYFIIIELID